MNQLRRYSIALRLVAVGVTVTAAIVFIVISLMGVTSKVRDFGVVEAGNATLEGRKAALAIGVDSMAASLGAALGGVTEPSAQGEILRKLTNPVRFEADKSGYYFVYRGTINVVHPLRPDFAGTNRAKTVDPNGVPYIAELARTAGTNHFVEYVFEKPGTKEKVPKISYAQKIPGTDLLGSLPACTSTT
ncbi:MAG: cache domain-containing protein [Polyangiaceae bacterium]